MTSGLDSSLYLLWAGLTIILLTERQICLNFITFIVEKLVSQKYVDGNGISSTS